MTPPDMPTVSIIMPAYNAQAYIGVAIQSVLDQDFQDWELLVIDDGSTDNTRAEIDRYRDSRIHVTQSGHLGSPAKVRNLGLKIARGRYVTFLDADDLYLPGALSKRVAVLETNPHLTAVYGFPQTINAAGQRIPQSVELTPTPEGGWLLPPGYGHTWEHVVLSRISCLLSALMMPRAVQQTVGLFNEDVFAVEDFEFYMRLFLHNMEGVICIPDYIYQYRIHAEGITKDASHVRRILVSSLNVIAWIFSHPKLPTSVQPFRAAATTDCFRYRARECLLHRNPTMARQLLHEAFWHPHITRREWVKQCLSLWIRTFLPVSLNQQLQQARQQFRHWRQASLGPVLQQ